ncbi:23216_t:CDS:2, partial [Gigaspora rosea]
MLNTEMLKSDDQKSPLLESTSSEPKQDPNHIMISPKFPPTNGNYLPMTIVSSMASQSWESADETVKAEYRRITKEALRVRNEMYPKSGRRKRKDR